MAATSATFCPASRKLEKDKDEMDDFYFIHLTATFTLSQLQPLRTNITGQLM